MEVSVKVWGFGSALAGIPRSWMTLSKVLHLAVLEFLLSCSTVGSFSLLCTCDVAVFVGIGE